MAGGTLAVANAILKEDYLGPLRTTLNVATPILDRVAKNSRDIAGLEVYIPIEMNLNQGIGARGEDTTLPDAGAGSYTAAKAKLTSYYGSMRCTGQAMRQTEKGEKGSFMRLVDLEAKGLKKMLSLVLAHDLYLGDKLADTVAGASVATVQLAADANMEYFFVGMLVDIIAADLTTIVSNGTGRTVSSVDKTNKTVTVSGSANLTPEDSGKVVRSGTLGVCINGLNTIIDDSADLHGLTVAGNPRWASTVKSAFGAFGTLKLQEQIDNVLIASGKQPTAFFTDYALQRKYWQTLTANPQYIATTPPKTLSGGFRSLEYVGGGEPIPWIADRLAPANTILGPHEPDLQFYTPGDWQFIEVGGDVWLPEILGSTKKDAYAATLFRDIQMGAMNRNSHLKITGVA